MRFLSLFAGIGGFDLGLERAGWQCAGQVEIEPFCQKVLAKHWPNVPRFNDVKTLTGEIVARHCGAVDLLAGGVPCQPASVAGKRKGAADDRWLWPDFLRLVSEIKPVWVLAENPRGVLSLPIEGMQFKEWIAREFESLGYSLFPIKLAAEDVGAPHRRERIFFVAYSAVIGRSRQAENARKSQFACGGDVANADLSQRWSPACEADERNGNDRRRQETASGLELRGEELADANYASAAGLRFGETAQHTIPGFGGQDLGNSNDPRLAQHAGQRSHARKEFPALVGAGWPSRPGQPQHEWEEPRTLDDVRLNFSVQVLDADSGIGRRAAHVGGTLKAALKSQVGLPASGVPVRLVRRHRVAALKALGNAVVPQVAEVIGRAILDSLEAA